MSKVYPHNASRRGAVAACDRSLRRLSTDRIDLYLLHWRGNVPLEETMEAFMGLQQTGKIRLYGVSNFDLADMQELWSVPAGSAVATEQLLYNLTRRDIEWDLLPWLRARHVPIMAYSPLEVQGGDRPVAPTTFCVLCVLCGQFPIPNVSISIFVVNRFHLDAALPR